MNYNNSLKSKEMRSSLGNFISDYSFIDEIGKKIDIIIIQIN
jgi:hypothetical protein